MAKIEKMENGVFCLTSSGSNTHPTSIHLSEKICHWFIEFQKGTKDKDEFLVDGITYQVARNSDGNVTLAEIKQGGFVSDISFSSEDIKKILMDFKNI